MAASESQSSGDWCSASVPVALPNGTPIDENQRRQLIEFLREACAAKLKPSQLATEASAMVQAWVKAGKPRATE
jgi:hypothetical protein